MKVVIYAATTLDGYIARKNGEEDFFSDDQWDEFCGIAKKMGCIVWGRKTYNSVKKWPKRYLNGLRGIKKIILSKNKIKSN